MACCFGTNEGEREPLLADQGEKSTKSNLETDEKKKKPTKSTVLNFTQLEVQEFDKVFRDFAQSLNPFVRNREKLEQAVAKFMVACESFQAIRPNASFREYVLALKTKLKDEGIFIKIKNGAVEVYSVSERSVKAVEDAITAIKNILSAVEALEDMPESVTAATGSSIQDAESSLENIEHIIKREFSGVFDVCKVCRFKKNLKSNITQLKKAPSMVKDFCQEAKMIAREIYDAFGDKSGDNKDPVTDANNREVSENGRESIANAKSKQNTEEARKKNGRTEVNKDKDNANSKSMTSEPEKKKENGKKAKQEKKEMKEDYHKQLKMETVGLADIDKIFTDLMTSLNKIVTTREKMQKARESFEKIMKTICNFEGKKELKAYLKELRDKAKEGKMNIYINTNDGEIKLDSISGVEPPAPYRNAVKALNDVKGSAKETLELMPIVENGIESCANDVMKIEPLQDFRKLVSGVKETMALPKKVKAFNENRKKVQQAPQIVRELCLYVKQILEDITSAFKDDNTSSEKEKEKEEKSAENDENSVDDTDKNEKKEKPTEAAIQIPGKSAKMGNIEQNDITAAC